LQGLLVALNLAVGAWRVGPCAQVTDRAVVQQLAQCLVVDVGERVVGHQSLSDDPMLKEPVQCAAGERGHGRGLLVVVDLRVRQAAAVINDRVDVLPADPGGAPGAIPRQRVPGPGEPPELLDVHMQQVPGARPHIAHDPRALGWLPPRAAPTPQDLVDSRVRAPNQHRDRPGTPARPLAQLTDPLLLPGRTPRGENGEDDWNLNQTRQRLSLSGDRRAPAAHPLPHRRLRHVPPRSSLREGHPVINDTTNDHLPPTRSHAGSMVRHSGPPLRW
jgi:hypothetical protein